MLRSDEYGNSYDDGQPDPNAADPSQRYITTYISDEFGNHFPQQVENPNYDVQRYDPEEYDRRVAYAATQRPRNTFLDKIGRAFEDNVTQRLEPFVEGAAQKFNSTASKYALPLIGAALTAGAGSQFLPGLMGAVGGGTGATAAGGTTAAGALGELGINTALAAGTPGGIAAGTTIGGLAGYTPELLHAAQSYISNPSNLANLAKQGYGAYKTIAGGAKPAAGLAPTGGLSSPFIDPTLDTSAEFLTGGGGGADKSALSQVYQQMTPDYPIMAAKGGSINDLSEVLKETFSEKNLFPQSKDLDDRPVLLTSQNPGIKSELAKLKRIKNVGGLAQGGLPEKYAAAAPQGHRPEFITGITGHYACGKGTGQSDDISAMLHDGDYVMDAETVSALGDGSSKAGKEVLEGFHKRIKYKAGGQAKPVPAKIADGEYVFDEGFVTALGGGDNRRGSDILDGLRERLRAHKRGAPVNKIPPKAKDPAAYIGKGK